MKRKEPIDISNKNLTCRLRRITPAEALRIMGVEEKYIKRMTNPRVELKKLGYTDDQIDILLVHNNKDKDLYKQAGNSIVVDVLYYIFEELFIPKAESKKNKVQCVA